MFLSNVKLVCQVSCLKFIYFELHEVSTVTALLSLKHRSVFYGLHLICHQQVIEYGGSIRSTGATGVNADSSRSHAILQLEVKAIDTQELIGR